MFSSLGTTGIGLLMLVLFGVFYWLGIFATTRAVLAFVGTCLLGTAGFLGGLFHTVAIWAAGLASAGTAWAGGVALGGLVLTALAGAIFIHDLHPKKTAGKRTGWAGIALAALLIAGVSGVQSFNNIPAQVSNGVTNAKQTLIPGG